MPRGIGHEIGERWRELRTCKALTLTTPHDTAQHPSPRAVTPTPPPPPPRTAPTTRLPALFLGHRTTDAVPRNKASEDDKPPGDGGFGVCAVEDESLQLRIAPASRTPNRLHDDEIPLGMDLVVEPLLRLRE